MTRSMERILVTVKTYPTLSRKYGETVCTAGVRPDGSWVRLYPVPFRRLDESQQYRKYDWIKCRLVRNTQDPRLESFRPVGEIELVEHVGTQDRWRKRREILLQTASVHTRLDELITLAKANQSSLSTFRPAKLLDFVIEREERQWSEKKLQQMRDLHGHLGLFEDNDWRKTFKVIPKLPFSFSYRFEDSLGKRSKLQILDWEIGALYWNCLRSSGGNEEEALQKVRHKYWDEFVTKDLHLFLGTTQQFHFVAPNPWVIVGVMPIPKDPRISLF